MSINSMTDSNLASLYAAPVLTPGAREPVAKAEKPISTKEELKQISKIENIRSVYEKKEELEQNLHEAMQVLQTYFDVNNTKLNFSMHETSDRMVVKIIDPSSGEILKELPSEAVLKMAANIEKFQDNISKSSGLLFDEMV